MSFGLAIRYQNEREELHTKRSASTSDQKVRIAAVRSAQSFRRGAAKTLGRCAALVPSWQECKQDLARCNKCQPLLLPMHLKTYNTPRLIHSTQLSRTCRIGLYSPCSASSQSITTLYISYTLHYPNSDIAHRATLPLSTTTCARISCLGIRHRPQCPS